MSKRAVLYARVAVGDADGANHKLVEQLAQCRNYALAQGWTVIAELHEDERETLRWHRRKLRSDPDHPGRGLNRR